MRRAGVLALAAALVMSGPAAAQEAAPSPPAETQIRAPVLVLQGDALFEGSAFGRAARERFEAESRALLTENREIERALEDEERALTERRATLPADEFRKLATAFDAKVEGIRTARDAKSRDITLTFDEERKRLLREALPVLGAIMSEFGATVILDRAQVVVNLEAIDITDLAIARIDAVIGAGAPPPAPPPAPAPTPAPAP